MRANLGHPRASPIQSVWYRLRHYYHWCTRLALIIVADHGWCYIIFSVFYIVLYWDSNFKLRTWNFLEIRTWNFHVPSWENTWELKPSSASSQWLLLWLVCNLHQIHSCIQCAIWHRSRIRLYSLFDWWWQRIERRALCKDCLTRWQH